MRLRNGRVYLGRDSASVEDVRELLLIVADYGVQPLHGRIRIVNRGLEVPRIWAAVEPGLQIGCNFLTWDKVAAARRILCK